MKLFIIPGFTESISDPVYQKLIRHGKRLGFDVVGVNIKWARRTMADYVQQFIKEYGDDARGGIVFGFSFGAVIALLSAKTTKPKRIILGSLSPYFAEDLSQLKSSWKRMVGKKRLEIFQQYRFSEVMKDLRFPIDAFVGTKEFPLVQRRTKLLAQYQNVTVKKIDGAKHDAGDSRYAQAIQDHLSTLAK